MDKRELHSCIDALESIGANTTALKKNETGFAYDKNANEVMHTTNTGFGAELINTGWNPEILDLMKTQPSFVNALTGFHGNDLPLTYTTSIMGDLGLFQKGDAEFTTGGIADTANAKTKIPTAKIDLVQKQYAITVDLSDYELRFNVARDNLVNIINNKIVERMMPTIEAAFLNSDTVTAATGNVNSDDAAPAGTEYYLAQDNGIRKTALAGGATTSSDAGALDINDLFDMEKALGINNDDSIFIFNNKTFTTATALSDFRDKAFNGMYSTTIENGTVMNTIFGHEAYKSRYLQLTEADGKISSVTPANNIKGGIILLNKAAIQYGFGNQGLILEAQRTPLKGIRLYGGFYMAFKIVNLVAGETDPSLFLKYNVTV
jgi:HK97 family phage major capsid protein